MKVLVIDNYDSFVYNLAQYVGDYADDVIVKRNDEITAQKARALRPDKIIISPGPGTPTDTRYFGLCGSIIQTISRETPTLGVCLGHQGIVYAFGGKIVRANHVRHGKTSPVEHDGKGIFQGIDNPFEATRYHSLVVDRHSVPESLQISAESQDDHEIMGIRHAKFPIEGVQFHPESILTRPGHAIIRNFLEA